MFVENNNLYIKNKNLYNVRTVDYLDSKPEIGLDIIAKETLQNDDIVAFFERIDTYSGLFSTQQLFNLDWEKFENHTFFDSAIAKVNYVFDIFLNSFPYDGSFFEYDQFVKKLDGYSYYLLKERFPKSNNSIYLGENYVEVIDSPGIVLKEKTSDRGFLDPKNKTFNFDFWINLDNNIEKNNRVIFQKYENNIGFTCYINNNTENTLNLSISNYKGETLIGTIDISSLLSSKRYIFDQESQDGYFHVSILVQPINIENIKKSITFLINGKKVNETLTGTFTTDFFEIENSDFKNSPFLIGNGYNYNDLTGDSSFALDGLIDEFRFFHKSRDTKKIIVEKDETIFAQSGLALYLKFNEPVGDYTNNFLALDSSGNKLHGQIKSSDDHSILQANQVSGIRSYFPAPIARESRFLFPVMFPGFSATKELQITLLNTANEYDSINPNLIFNMFPKHYFIEGSDFEGKTNIFANSSSFVSKDTLGIVQPATQEFVNILLIWARFFDEIKSYIDNISEIININYEDLNNKEPFGLILPLATKMLGFDFKNIFPSPAKDKLDGYNLSYDYVQNKLGIRKIQNEIWKRILINTQDFLRSKGTINSIKSIFNSAGIESDKFIDIKEFNGKNKINFSESNMIVSQNIKFIDFSNSNIFFENNEFILGDNVPKFKLRLETAYLKDHNSNSDTDYEIDDYTFEGYYSFNEVKKNILNIKQSLIILNSYEGSSSIPIASLTFERLTQDNNYGNLLLKVKPTNNSADNQEIKIEKINLINGEMWHISFGRKIKYVKGDIKVYENFLYLRQAGNKKYISYYLKNKKHEIDFAGKTDYFNKGQKNLTLGLNNKYPDITTIFEGEISNLRFYKVRLELNDLFKRSNDVTYVGFKNPLDKRNLILNYDLTEEILDTHISTSTDNQTRKIYINDKSDFIPTRVHSAGHRSKNDAILTRERRSPGFLVTGNTGEKLISCIKRKNINIIKNDIRFDEVFSSEKIKINSFEDQELANLNNKIISPSAIISPDMTQFNELRLSIEHSNVKYLNQDISKLIGSFEFLSNAYGLSSNIYDTNYIDIKKVRNSYFEKLTKEIDYKPMQQFFKYFDNILTNLLDDVVPDKVNYMGFNYVYESHALERHKYEYKMSESRIPIEDSGYNFSRPKINSPRTESYTKNREHFLITSSDTGDS